MTFERTDPSGQSHPLLLRPVGPGYHAIGGGPSTSATQGGTQAWELIDPWASPEESSAATAATRRLGQVVSLVDVAVALRAPEGTVRRLIEQLITFLRRSDASVIFCSIQAPGVREELLDAGFVPVPPLTIRSSGSSHRRRTLMLQL